MRPNAMLPLAAAVLAMFAVLPSSAAEPGFRLDFGGGSFSFGLPFAAGAAPASAACLADRDIRSGLNRHGWSDVRLRRDFGGGRVEVLARNQNWIYSMRLDRCSGEVDGIERLRPVLGEGFGFQFDFGIDDKEEQGDLK
jgi:hypothetical protein